MEKLDINLLTGSQLSTIEMNGNTLFVKENN